MEFLATIAIIIVILLLVSIIAMRVPRIIENYKSSNKYNTSENTEESSNPKEKQSNNRAQSMQKEDNKTDYSGLKPRDLLLAILKNMSCKIEFDDEDPERIYFNFQGENFCTNATNDCLMVTIYDFSWGSVDIDDIDEVSNLRKAINTTNLYTGLCLTYTMDIEHHRMIVHTKRQILLVPEIPNIDDYVMAMLTGFFDAQRTLSKELDKLREGKKSE